MQLDPEKELYVLEIDELKVFEPAAMPLEWPITESLELFVLILGKMENERADMKAMLPGITIEGIELIRDYHKTQVILNNMAEVVFSVLKVIQVSPPGTS